MLYYAVLLFGKLSDASKAALIASVVTFGGTLFAALAALIGVYVTHRGHERRLQKQLAHESEQKRVEREMALRKEVYLDAAEAIVAGLGIIVRHADLSVPQDKLAQEFAEKRSSLAKIHLVGSQETVNAVSAFSTELSAAVLRLTLLRLPLLQLQARIKLLDDQVRTFGQERDRMVELMKQLNFAGDMQEHRWKFVQTTFEFEQKRTNGAIEEQKSLRSKLRTEWLKYAALSYEVSGKVSHLLVPAVKAAREELGLPVDVKEYRQLVETSVKRQNEMLNEFLSGFDKIDA